VQTRSAAAPAPYCRAAPFLLYRGRRPPSTTRLAPPLSPAAEQFSNSLQRVSQVARSFTSQLPRVVAPLPRGPTSSRCCPRPLSPCPAPFFPAAAVVIKLQRRPYVGVPPLRVVPGLTSQSTSGCQRDRPCRARRSAPAARARVLGCDPRSLPCSRVHISQLRRHILSRRAVCPQMPACYHDAAAAVIRSCRAVSFCPYGAPVPVQLPRRPITLQ